MMRIQNAYSEYLNKCTFLQRIYNHLLYQLTYAIHSAYVPVDRVAYNAVLQTKGGLHIYVCGCISVCTQVYNCLQNICVYIYIAIPCI